MTDLLEPAGPLAGEEPFIEFSSHPGDNRCTAKLRNRDSVERRRSLSGQQSTWRPQGSRDCKRRQSLVVVVVMVMTMVVVVLAMVLV